MKESADQGLLEHLEELRRRLLRSIVAFVVAFVVAYIFHRPILRLLVFPVLEGLKNQGIYHLQVLTITEGFMTYIKAAVIGGAVLASPFILREIWLFVSPGLYPSEKRVVLPAFFVLFLFFIAGVLFSYLVFVPLVVNFLASLSPSHTVLIPRLSDVLSLSLLFYIVFGVVFEVPLIMFILSFLGLFSAHQYLKAYKYFIVVAFILGALFSPPDPLSQVLIAVPLCILYGLGILASLAVARAKRTVGGSLRVLFAMALGMILVTIGGYVGWRYYNPLKSDSPLKLLGPETCVMVIDPRVTPCSECLNSKRVLWIAKGGDVKRLTKAESCPEGTHKRGDYCVEGSEGLPEVLLRGRFPYPSGIWCKEGETFLGVYPSSTGNILVGKGVREKHFKGLLPSPRWPFQSKEGVYEAWIPRTGSGEILMRAFESLRASHRAR